MKLQIALDYLMVFIFILFIFILVFASIAKQRAILSEQQTYAQLQLVSQTVAAELTSATQAGNGYTGSIQLPQQLSVLGYNLSITTRGMVIASSNVFGQEIQATSFGLVQGIVSNTLYLSQSKLYYAIPTVASTGYLTLQNSFGTICVDYQCPLTSSQPSQLTVYDQVAGTLKMNGYNNNAMLATPPTTSSTESVSFWMKASALPSSTQFIIDQGNFLSNPQEPQYNWIAVSPTGAVEGGPAPSQACASTIAIKQNVWYFVTYTVNGMLDIYINANLGSGCEVSIVNPAEPNDLIVGEEATGQPSTAFNGSIADLQIYNTSLTQQQVSNLYSEGITGIPISPANIVAWYTFSGSGNDYSGNNKNLVVNGPASYPSVAQIFASAANATGTPISGVPIGFITSIGNFTNGQATSNSTNANGIAYAFLNQGVSGGYANVKASAFNGNSYTSTGLIGWWPLSEGQGTYAHDTSIASTTQNTFNGNIINAYWALPSYVAKFDGLSSIVQVPNAQSLQASSITVSAWVNYTDPSSGPYDFVVSKSGAWELGACGQNLAVCYYNPSTGSSTSSSTTLSIGKWYFITETITSGGSETTYVNGVKVLSGSASSTFTQSNGIQIGYSNINSVPSFMNGYVADLQIYSSILSQSQVSTLYGYGIDGSPLNGAGIIGWWPLDGNANDYSGYGNNGIIYGNLNMVPLGFQSGHGSQFLSAGFNSVNTYVSLGSNSILTPNTNVIASAWIRTSSSQFMQTVFSTTAPSSTNGYTLYLSSGLPTFAVGTCSVSSTGSSVANGQWHFIAGTYNGISATIFIDGVQQNVNNCYASQTSINYGTPSSASGVIGGVNPFAAANGFVGYISDVQLYNGTMTPGTLFKLYSEGVTGFPLQSSGLAGWWPLNGDANDYSVHGNDGSFTNYAYYAQSTLQSYLTPSLNGAGLTFANGLYANVIVPGNLLINGPFTVSAWINPGVMSGEGTVVGKMNSFSLDVDSNGKDEGDFFAYVGGTQYGPTITPFALSPGEWYMLTGVYNGTYMTTFLNGIPVNILAVSGAVSSNKNPTVMGSSPISPYTQYYFNGTIADVQVYNTPLTSAQVYQLYNVGTPPSGSVSVPLGGNT